MHKQAGLCARDHMHIHLEDAAFIQEEQTLFFLVLTQRGQSTKQHPLSWCSAQGHSKRADAR